MKKDYTGATSQTPQFIFVNSSPGDGTDLNPPPVSARQRNISSGLQPATQNGDRMEEATIGACNGGPKHAAYGFLAKRTRLPGPITPVFEADPTKLKARLIKYGAAQEDVDLCDEVFKDGVTVEALERRLTRSQCEKLGLRDGRRYRILLEKVEVTGESMTRNRCRLCPRDHAKMYKHRHDSLRHLLKDHFGLYFKCPQW